MHPNILNWTSTIYLECCFWFRWKPFFLTRMLSMKFCVMLRHLSVENYLWAIVNLTKKWCLICWIYDSFFYVYYHLLKPVFMLGFIPFLCFFTSLDFCFSVFLPHGIMIKIILNKFSGVMRSILLICDFFVNLDI